MELDIMQRNNKTAEPRWEWTGLNDFSNKSKEEQKKEFMDEIEIEQLLNDSFVIDRVGIVWYYSDKITALLEHMDFAQIRINNVVRYVRGKGDYIEYSIKDIDSLLLWMVHYGCAQKKREFLIDRGIHLDTSTLSGLRKMSVDSEFAGSIQFCKKDFMS